VLAADSQRTEGTFRETIPKLFKTPADIIWGIAGNLAIQQELYSQRLSTIASAPGGKARASADASAA